MTQMNTSHLTNNESGEGTQSSCWDPFPLDERKLVSHLKKNAYNWFFPTISTPCTVASSAFLVQASTENSRLTSYGLYFWDTDSCLLTVPSTPQAATVSLTPVYLCVHMCAHAHAHFRASYDHFCSVTHWKRSQQKFHTKVSRGRPRGVQESPSTAPCILPQNAQGIP